MDQDATLRDPADRAARPGRVPAGREARRARGQRAAATAACDGATGDDMLARICEAGVIQVSTDPEYPPQSFLEGGDGEFEGFDIDVANEIAERLGVEVEFETPSFDAVVAGGWTAVGHERRVGHDHRGAQGSPRLHRSRTTSRPAQIAVALTESGITDLEGFAGADDLRGGQRRTSTGWTAADPAAGGGRGRAGRRRASRRPPSRPIATAPKSWRSGRTRFRAG